MEAVRLSGMTTDLVLADYRIATTLCPDGKERMRRLIEIAEQTVAETRDRRAR